MRFIIFILGMLSAFARASVPRRQLLLQRPEAEFHDSTRAANLLDHPDDIGRCDPEDVDTLYPDPDNNEDYWHCTPSGLVLQHWGKGLIFKPSVSGCDSETEGVTWQEFRAPFERFGLT